MTVCGKCRAEIDEASVFCPNCGVALGEDRSPTERMMEQRALSKEAKGSSMAKQMLKFRPATFGFALFCFVLPFVTMSCPGGRFTFSGLQMVTGTTVQEHKMGAEPLAAVGLLCALAGLVLCLLKRDNLDIAVGVAGASGGVALLLLKAKIEKDALENGSGMVQISFGPGFWLALLALVAGGALSYLQWQDRARNAARRETGATATSPSP